MDINKLTKAAEQFVRYAEDSSLVLTASMAEELAEEKEGFEPIDGEPVVDEPPDVGAEEEVVSEEGEETPIVIETEPEEVEPVEGQEPVDEGEHVCCEEHAPASTSEPTGSIPDSQFWGDLEGILKSIHSPAVEKLVPGGASNADDEYQETVDVPTEEETSDEPASDEMMLAAFRESVGIIKSAAGETGELAEELIDAPAPEQLGGDDADLDRQAMIELFVESLISVGESDTVAAAKDAAVEKFMALKQIPVTSQQIIDLVQGANKERFAAALAIGGMDPDDEEETYAYAERNCPSLPSQEDIDNPPGGVFGEEDDPSAEIHTRPSSRMQELAGQWEAEENEPAQSSSALESILTEMEGEPGQQEEDKGQKVEDIPLEPTALKASFQAAMKKIALETLEKPAEETPTEEEEEEEIVDLPAEDEPVTEEVVDEPSSGEIVDEPVDPSLLPGDETPEPEAVMEATESGLTPEQEEQARSIIGLPPAGEEASPAVVPPEVKSDSFGAAEEGMATTEEETSVDPMIAEEFGNLPVGEGEPSMPMEESEATSIEDEPISP
jgi:hypothetical protein